MNITGTEMLPGDIEKKSFEIITAELGSRHLDPENEGVIKRVIHTTADFEYVNNLVFSDNAVQLAVAALRSGATIITDTQMVKAGINKAACAQLGCKAECFMSDADVAEQAEQNATTRAVASMDKAAKREGLLIFAIGNAPTALLRICQLMEQGKLSPALIIGVPVGFVNVVESKEMIIDGSVPHIVSRGRKGGSNVAAAICNALLYKATGRVL